MAKRGFTLSEMLIVLVIIGVVSAVTIPMLSVKKKVGNFEANSLKCVKTELAANLASTACTAAIKKAQYGQEKSINTLAFLAINGKDINEKNAANAVLRQVCDNGGDKACSYFVTACQRDSSLCNTGGVYDLKHYLNLPQDTNDYAKFLIYEKTKPFYDSNNTNIKTIVDNTCCPSLNMACAITGCTSCPLAMHYGGTQKDGGQAIALSGNYAYISGYETSDSTTGDMDIYVMKFNITDATTEWKKHYGGADNENGTSITISDNYIYVSGGERSDTAGQQDILVMKLDLNGNAQWKKRYGGADNENGISSTILDNYIYVTGGERSDTAGQDDIFVMKLDLNGNAQWKKHYGGTNIDVGSSITTLYNNIYITGYELSDTVNSSVDIFVMQLDLNGNTLWKKHYGGDGNETGIAITAANNNIYITGHETSHLFSDYDIFVMQLDLNGNTLWKKHYGGSGNDDEGKAIVVAGSYAYVTGNENSDTAGNYDIFVMKLNISNGKTLWKKHYGGADNEFGRAIALSGNYLYITGMEASDTAGNYDILVMRLDTNQTTSNMNPSNWTVDGVAMTPANWAADGLDINPANWTANDAAMNPANWTIDSAYIKKTTDNLNYFTVGLKKDGIPIQ